MSEENAVTETEVQSEEEWLDLLGSGSILKKVTRAGIPDTRPQHYNKCTINYQLLCNDEIIENEKDFELQLGEGDVVPGLDLSISFMNLEERCLLKIESRLAYGELGTKNIPPNAIVCYDIELLKVAPGDDPEECSVAQRKLMGNRKKERGNWWYGRNDNTHAIQCYRRALDYLNDATNNENNQNSDNILQDLLEDRLSVLNNMAAAQIKLELYDAALTSLESVLSCQPNNVKALFRKAKVYRAKNEPITAMTYLKQANEITANSNNDIKKEMMEINDLIQKQNKSERELAKRMFNTSSCTLNGSLKKTNTKRKHKQKRSLIVWGATAAVSFSIALVGVAVYRLKFA